jgi:GTP-binding protein HflX
MKSELKETQKPRSKALLVGVQLPRTSDEETENSLIELGRLVTTLGFGVIGKLSQKRPSTSGALVLGEGKLSELSRWTGGTGKVEKSVQVKKSKAAERFSASDNPEDVDSNFENETDAELDVRPDTESDTEPEPDTESDGETEDVTKFDPTPSDRADVVVFDCELTPSQIRNLESALSAQVLDRTGVIIEIFSRHARTRAARLQVEIARLTYLAPRLRETGGGSGDRQGGGIGGKGAGETSQELDRRRIRDRIKELKDELASVQNESAIRRNRRSEENCVALIGYTNAGKSSLMRAMTGSEILVADQLFATLETTVRPLDPPSMPRVLLSDTVGFIKKLPHDLVASFRSTLDEALNADLLLFVVDCSDPAFRSQLGVTMEVISEIGAGETHQRLILNKRDRLSAEDQAQLMSEFPDAIMLSTRNKDDLSMLREHLLSFFEGEMMEEEIFVPYQAQGAIGEIRREMRVLEESFDTAGTLLKVRVRPEALARYRRRFPQPTD